MTLSRLDDVNEDRRPEVSVIVPAYIPSDRADRTLRTCVDKILSQDLPRGFEVIVVASADGPDRLPQLPADSRLTVVTFTSRIPAARARNIGVERSRGRLLAFADADVLAEKGWLAELVRASDGGRLVVGGGVTNGTPRSPVGTILYLVEFIDLHPGRPPRTAWHGATCNLLVPRGLWDVLGPFPEDMEGGEDTMMTVMARERGVFVFEGSARVAHLNRRKISEVLGHLFAMGKFTAHLSRRSWMKHGFLMRHSVLAPAAALGRAVSIYARVFVWGRELWVWAVVASPLVVAGLVSWAAGLAAEGAKLEAADRRRA